MQTTMQAIRSTFDLDGFFARVRAASQRVLVLDYDGTLAPFRLDPAEAVPYPGVAPLLDAIMAAGHTRLVIVTGRWTKTLLPLLGLKRRPELWGSHGWERLTPAGDYDTARISESALKVLVEADEWVAEIEALGGRAERKPASIAFHWRGLANDRIADIRDKVFEKWMDLGHQNGLAWHDFDGGIELRAAGRDKGYAVRTLADESSADAAFAYLGDDLTDEDAFKAVPDNGAAVLVRAQFRPSAADLWIRPPDELLEFLTRWQEAAATRSRDQAVPGARPSPRSDRRSSDRAVPGPPPSPRSDRR
jgi:trehalose-phosphatase